MLTKNEKEKVKDIIALICDELEIDEPKTIYARYKEMSETTKAMVVINKSSPAKMYIDPETQLNPEIVFIIAHELRHIYQYENNLFKDHLEKHINSKEINTEEYNLQPEEVDAHAFGYICMSDMTGYKPLFNGLSSKVKIAIQKRVQQIMDEEYY